MVDTAAEAKEDDAFDDDDFDDFEARTTTPAKRGGGGGRGGGRGGGGGGKGKDAKSPSRLPVDLGGGWIELFDESSGRIYYFNRSTRVTSWEKP